MFRINKKTNNTTSIVIITCLAVAVIGLLIALIVQTNKKNDYVINYHTDDKVAEEIIENNKTDTTKPNTEVVIDDTTTTDVGNYISIERALEIALENVGAAKQNVRDIDVELDYKFGQTVYEVTFDYNGYEYEYYLNPTSSEIIKSFKEVDR